jgi:transcriptional regulator with XRE-family HTH domain
LPQGEHTTTVEARAQGQRLRLLREQRGLSKSLLASRLGFGSTQSLDLYERGISVIRLDRLTLWAEAFELSVEDFVSTVIGAAAEEPGWTFRNALRGHIPESLIEQLAATWEGRPLVNQQAAVEAILEMAAEIRSESNPSGYRQNNAQAV